MINKNEYFNFLDKKYGKNNKCLLINYKKIFLNNVQYPTVNTNQQIKFLINEIYRTKNIIEYNNFILLLTNFMSFNASFKLFNIICTTDKIKDIDVINYIESLQIQNRKRNSIYSLDEVCSKQKFGFELIYSHIENNLKKMENNIKYLDIGCGDGIKTKLFAEILNINKDNIYGTDIKMWGPYSNKKNFSFNFKYIEKDKLKYDDNSFDVLTCFLTLHHIKNINTMIDEIKRVLKPNGIFILIEHDALTYFDKLLIDIQHTFFAFFYDKNKNYIKKPLYSKYYNQIEFEYIFVKKHKFKLLYKDNLYQNIKMQKRYDQQFYSVFSK